MRSNSSASFSIFQYVCLVTLTILVNPTPVVFGEQGGRKGTKETIESLEPSKFLESVLANHPFVKATEQDLQGAEAELLTAQGGFDPVLKSEFSNYAEGNYSGTYTNVFAEQPLEWNGAKVITGYRRGGGTFPVYDEDYKTKSEGETRAGMELPLLRDRTTDARRTALKRALLQSDGAALSIEQRKLELARAAAHSFWEWSAAAERFQAYQSLLKAAEARDIQMKKRMSAGDISKFDYNDNQRQILQRQAQFVSAQRALNKTEYDLSLFFWNDRGETEKISHLSPPQGLLRKPPHPLLKLEGAIEQALAQRPELHRLTNSIQQQELAQALAENQTQPRLDVQAYGAQDFGEGSPSRDEFELKTGVKLEIPLLNRAFEGKLLAASAKQKELTIQREYLRAKIQNEVSDAHNNLSLSLERVKILQQEVELARELESGEREKLSHGDSNLIFVNLREQATTDAVVRHIDALADCWKTYAAYKAVLGETGVFGTSL